MLKIISFYAVVSFHLVPETRTFNFVGFRFILFNSL